MRTDKYVGLDVDKSTIVAVVQNCEGRNLIKTVIEMEGVTVREFVESLSGKIRVTFEEGKIKEMK